MYLEWVRKCVWVVQFNCVNMWILDAKYLKTRAVKKALQLINVVRILIMIVFIEMGNALVKD